MGKITSNKKDNYPGGGGGYLRVFLLGVYQYLRQVEFFYVGKLVLFRLTYTLDYWSVLDRDVIGCIIYM